MPRRPGFFLLGVLTALPTLSAPAGGGDGAGKRPSTPVAWTKVDPAERDLLARQLASPHWPMRAIALMRLERYAGDGRDALVAARLEDPAWQVRCFALRAAHRMGVTVAPALLEPERNGRVLRAALRFGVPLDEQRLAPGTRRLMRSRSLDELVLGLEIAAASDVKILRREATRRTRRIFRRMDEGLFLRISRPLARIVGRREGDPDSIDQWKAWLAARQGQITLAPPASSRTGAGDAPPLPPRLASLDPETFSRLLEYLDALRQRDLDLAIVMDSTTSMVPMINETRAGVESLILFLDDVSRTMRGALIAYRDHDNPPIWEGEKFTTDVAAIRDFLYDLRITGGRDLPEAVLEGLTACGDLRWSPRASRQIVLVGDARPHEEDEYRLHELMESFRGNGIVVHTIHVPMRINPLEARRLPPNGRELREREIARHNALTARAFGRIAEAGGGVAVTLRSVNELVPSIMHLTIEEAWWAYFDEFYTVYLELCR